MRRRVLELEEDGDGHGQWCWGGLLDFGAGDYSVRSKDTGDGGTPITFEWSTYPNYEDDVDE